MKQLEPIPQCVDCLMSLARDVTALAESTNPETIEEVDRISRETIEGAAENQFSSPQIANRLLREIRQITRTEDPYAEFKSREMAQASKVYCRLKKQIDEHLHSRVCLAALGNSLDFFKNPAQALADIPDLFNNGISFYYDNLAQLEAFLANGPQQVLYLTDNAGEIYFDIPFYDYLKQRCRRVELVVKGGPALNDLTRAELHSAQLEDRFDKVADTGADGAGIDWDNVSAEFLDLFGSADLIISKGMANFETLYPKTIPMPSFYLLKVKCEPIQNYIQAPVDSFLALWKEGEYPTRRSRNED
ncbi:MAG: DUF89 family protein [bacterium]|nr:DUF89 family protein [bacterium]